MKDWEKIYQEKLVTPQEAVRIVHDGDTVFIGSEPSVAEELAEVLYDRNDELSDVTITSVSCKRNLRAYWEPDSHFRVMSFFVGDGERCAIQTPRGDYSSLHLSRYQQFATDFMAGGVAFVQVPPPDENGYMSFGTSGCSSARFACDIASRIVLQVNRRETYQYGRENLIHVSEADYIVEMDGELRAVPDQKENEVQKKIADLIVDEVPDGATIQLGIGGLSSAIGYGLKDKNDLGVHSEMYTNSMMYLTKRGVITNARKKTHPGKSVASFIMGDRELYDFTDHNEGIYMAPYYYVNNPYLISQNDNFISVNTAMAIDLYGQVAAENMAGRQFSGSGGQVDYVRGAQLSKGGKSIIAIPSTRTDKNGKITSRIVPYFPPFTVTTTAREDVQYIATEYGCINLQSLSMQDRIRAVISLAHPDFRDELLQTAKDHHLIF